MTEQRTLTDLIAGFAQWGDRPAIVAFDRDGASRLSFAELEDKVRRLAGGLAAAGVGKGDRIAIYAHNRAEWVVACLGVITAGAVVVPLDVRLGKEALAHEIRHSKAARIFISRELAEPLRDVLDRRDVPELIVIDADEGIDDGPTLSNLLGERPDSLPPVAPDDTAALFYTSGTTGLPKGVPLTHGNLLSNLDAMGQAELATPRERALLPLPLHHVYPFTVGMLVPLAGGAAVVLPADVSGPEVVRALREGEATVIIGVPRLYEALVTAIRRRVGGRGRLFAAGFDRLLRLSMAIRRRLGWRIGRPLLWPIHKAVAPRLHLLASGGAALDPDTARTLEGMGWEVLTGYGLTETSPIVAFNPRGGARLDTVGKPLPGVHVRIDPIEEKEGGEIVVAGPNVFAGYLDNPEATQKAFTEDGWFRTEDLGRLDDDGYLTILARVKETIVLSGGKNVFPEEVEERYAQSAYIREFAVLDVNGALAALVVPDVKAIREGGDDDIREAIRGELRRIARDLPSYQRVSDVEIVRQSLPYTSLGKLRRHLLPEMFEQARSEGDGGGSAEQELSDADRQLVEADPARGVWEWLQERYPDKQVALDSSLQTDLGIDSLEWVTLTLELQERHGLRLTEDTAARIETVRELLEEAMEAEPAPAADAGALAPEHERWLEPYGPVTALLARMLFRINRLLFRTLFRLRVEGTENLPDHGPVVLAPNHLSYLDPFVIAAALPRRFFGRTSWAGYAGIMFSGPLRRAFSRLVRAIPIDAARAPATALALGNRALQAGEVLVWFPEGIRSADGQLQRFAAGIGRIVDGVECPFVPVFIEGTYEAWPRQRRLPRLHAITVRIGSPVSPSVLDGEGEGDARDQRIASGLRKRVAKLAP